MFRLNFKFGYLLTVWGNLEGIPGNPGEIPHIESKSVGSKGLNKSLSCHSMPHVLCHLQDTFIVAYLFSEMARVTHFILPLMSLGSFTMLILRYAHGAASKLGVKTWGGGGATPVYKCPDVCVGGLKMYPF